MRHLSPDFAAGALRRGASIEALLPPDEQGRVRWVTARPEGHHYELHLFVLDTPVPDGWRDFVVLIPDEALDASEHGRYSTPNELLVASETLGAAQDRWVNQGLVGEEYWNPTSP